MHTIIHISFINLVQNEQTNKLQKTTTLLLFQIEMHYYMYKVYFTLLI